MVLSAKWVPPKVAVTATGLTLIWAEDRDGDKLMAGVQDICGWRLEIVTGWDEVTEFKVVPKGRMVERTFAGLDRCRRWSQDSEYLVSASENMICIAMIQLTLRRLAINPT